METFSRIRLTYLQQILTTFPFGFSKRYKSQSTYLHLIRHFCVDSPIELTPTSLVEMSKTLVDTTLRISHNYHARTSLMHSQKCIFWPMGWFSSFPWYHKDRLKHNLLVSSQSVKRSILFVNICLSRWALKLCQGMFGVTWKQQNKLKLLHWKASITFFH